MSWPLLRLGVCGQGIGPRSRWTGIGSDNNRARAKTGAAGAELPPRRARIALAGLATVIAFLSGFGIWTSQQTNAAAKRSSEATKLSDAYLHARFSVGQEESLERKYRLEPGPEVRALYDVATAELIASLRTIDRVGEPADRALVGRLLTSHDEYRRGIGRLFDAVDAGDARRVQRIDTDEVDPLFASIEEEIDAAEREQHSLAFKSLAELGDTERFAVIATPIAFGLGLGLLGFFAYQLALVYSRMRHQAEESSYAALHDPLTGLPNRTMLTTIIERQIQESRAAGAVFSLLMIDLDRFKEINDSLGHDTGDQLLREIGPRMQQTLRSVDVAARLSGDEFAVFLPGTDGRRAAAVAERIRTAVLEPFAIADLSLTIDASVGIVTFPTHGGTAEDLLQRVDVAMYLAKDRKRGPAVYEPEDDPFNPERLTLVGDLRSAIAAGELEVHYQPKYEIASLRMTGAEALVRWNHPSRGMLPPDEFIPLAEHTGLIRPLTLLVMGKAVRQCCEWNEAGFDLSVAVNLSVANLIDLHLIEDVVGILEREGLPPARLELEITESMVMVEPELALRQLRGLRALGVRLAVDDFGTGYSSLAYLSRLPVEVLKIDRSFVRDLATDADAASIVRSTIDLAHNLGLRVVAEGIEDAAALAIVEKFGCDEAQGFHLCRPAPPQDLIDELRGHAVEALAVTART